MEKQNNLLIDELEESTEFLLNDIQVLQYLCFDLSGDNREYYSKIETIRKSMTYAINKLEKIIDKYYQELDCKK